MLTVKLTSFNGTSLTGITTEGFTLTANVTMKTIYHQVIPNQHPVHPQNITMKTIYHQEVLNQHPIHPLFVNYSTAFISGSRTAILNAVTALANAGVSAQVRLEPYNNTVASFRPVSSII
ncbi:hypothetical protein [Bacillus cereus]|uniref:hypothetical protein n=1 Tax=Bacillus cereus TaxID=1396 RepID=UPI001E657A2F|nr:hypothetical protein [Bacillus cereus]